MNFLFNIFNDDIIFGYKILKEEKIFLWIK